MQVAVLGMHRSGTSALTRLLGFIGCHLGDEGDFNPVRPDNPAGDWERTDVWALNEDVLSALDATWCRVAGFDLARLDAATLAGFQARAREVVARLAARQPWAIKDPRMCLTFPIWRAALEAPVCVLTLRDPLSVARSLRRRDGFPLSVGLALWEAHALGALRHSRGLPRLTVAYESLMRDPLPALRGLRRELEDAGVHGLSEPDEAAVRAFIDPALEHASRGDHASAVCLTPAQARLTSALGDRSALAWDDVPALAETERDLLDGYFRLRQELEGVALERDRRATELQHKAEEVERLAEARRRAEVLALRSEALVRRVADLERTHATLAQDSSAFQREIEALERAGEALTRHNAELTRRNADLARMRAEEAAAGRATLEGHRQLVRRAEDDLDEVLRRAGELQRLLELILASRRFRYGDRAGELLGKALLRPAQPRAAEHARRIVAEFRRACEGVQRRRAEPTSD